MKNIIEHAKENKIKKTKKRKIIAYHHHEKQLLPK